MNNIIDQYKGAGMRVRAWWLRFNWNNVIRYRYSKSKYRFVYVVFRINEVSRQPAIHRAEQFFPMAQQYSRAGLPHCRGFTIALKRDTLGRSPLDEWSARRRDFYLIIHNMHERQTSKLPVEFEPAITQTHASDCVDTGCGRTIFTRTIITRTMLPEPLLLEPCYPNHYYSNHVTRIIVTRSIITRTIVTRTIVTRTIITRTVTRTIVTRNIVTRAIITRTIITRTIVTRTIVTLTIVTGTIITRTILPEPLLPEPLLPEPLRWNCYEIVKILQIIICWRNFRNTVPNKRQIWPWYVLVRVRKSSYRSGRKLLLHLFIEITINLIFVQEFGFYQMHTKFHRSTSFPSTFRRIPGCTSKWVRFEYWGTTFFRNVSISI